MADRVIRDEIWQSDRFLDLPTDACRLAFLRFLALADDFGNFEGGEKRILRILQACTQIKGPEASSATIDALMACDLIRRYEVEGRELFHIPRFKSHRQYLSQRYPASPWCDKTKPLGKDRRIKISGLASDVVTTSLPRSNHVAEGVGVGVGVGKVKTIAQNEFARFWKAYPKKKSKGQAEKAFSKIKPELIDTVLKALSKARESPDWQKEGGTYIPYPATWLNARGWEDEFSVETGPQSVPCTECQNPSTTWWLGKRYCEQHYMQAKRGELCKK